MVMTKTTPYGCHNHRVDMAPKEGKAKKRHRKGHKGKSDKRHKDHDIIGFQAGQHCQVSGATGSGKTEFTVDVILGEGSQEGRAPPWDAVVVFCDPISIHQKAFKRLEDRFKGPGGVTFYDQTPPDPEAEKEFFATLKSNFEEGWKTVVILDDLMHVCKNASVDKFVSTLFTSGRHLNVSTWELVQCHTNSRTRRLQVGYMVCFATPSDVKSLAHICNSIRPETKGHDLLQCYREATESKNGHGCLIISLNSPREFMFRKNVMDECFDLRGHSSAAQEEEPSSDIEESPL
jgi:hypothetical protein